MINLRGKVKYLTDLTSTKSGTMIKSFKICNGWKKGEEVIFNWFKCIGFNDMAFKIQAEFLQDDYVEVEGWLQIDSYTDKMGEKKSVHNVIVQKIIKLEQPIYNEPNEFNEKPSTTEIPNLGDIPF